MKSAGAFTSHDISDIVCFGFLYGFVTPQCGQTFAVDEISL
jgi:hypothetical protein